MSDEKQTKRRGGARGARPGQKLLSGQQASQEFGPPYTSLRDLYLRGELPGVRFPGSRRIWYLRADLEALISRSRFTA